MVDVVQNHAATRWHEQLATHRQNLPRHRYATAQSRLLRLDEGLVFPVESFRTRSGRFRCERWSWPRKRPHTRIGKRGDQPADGQRVVVIVGVGNDDNLAPGTRHRIGGRRQLATSLGARNSTRPLGPRIDAQWPQCRRKIHPQRPRSAASPADSPSSIRAGSWRQ